MTFIGVPSFVTQTQEHTLLIILQYYKMFLTWNGIKLQGECNTALLWGQYEFVCKSSMRPLSNYVLPPRMVNSQLFGPMVYGMYSLAAHDQTLEDNMYAWHYEIAIEMIPNPPHDHKVFANGNLRAVIGPKSA